MLRVETGDGATTADTLHFGRDNAGTLEWFDLTGGGGGGTTIVVQEGDTDKVTALTTLDFDASDFDVSESPTGEGNVSLAYGTSAGTPAEGNHTHAPTAITVTVQEGDSTVDAAVTTIDFDASDFNVSSTPAGEANVSLAYGTTAGTPAEGNHTHAVSFSGVIFGGWISQGNFALYQMVAGAGVSATGNALTANEMVASLFAVPVSTTFDQITVQVTTAVAGTTIRVGVYAVGADGLPGALIADWGTVSSATTGAKTLSISWSPTANWYFIVMSCSGAAAVSRFTSGMGVAPFGSPVGSIAIAGITDWIKPSPGSAAALPASFGVTPTATGTHRPTWLRVA